MSDELLLQIVRLSTSDPWYVTAVLIGARVVTAAVLIDWIVYKVRHEATAAPWRTRHLTWTWAHTLFLIALTLAFVTGILRSLLVGHIREFNAVGAAFRDWEMTTSSLVAVMAIVANWKWRHPATPVADAGVFAALAQAMPVVVTDWTSTIRYATDPLHTLGGYPPGSLVGKPLETIMPDRFHASHRAGLARYLRTGEKVVLDRVTPLALRRADGSEVPIWLVLTSTLVDGKPWFAGELRPREIEEAP